MDFKKRYKEKCMCQHYVCEANGLKESFICQNTLHHICGKSDCRIDGKFPYMILPASMLTFCKTTKTKLALKR